MFSPHFRRSKSSPDLSQYPSSENWLQVPLEPYGLERIESQQYMSEPKRIPSSRWRSMAVLVGLIAGATLAMAQAHGDAPDAACP